MLLPDGTPAGGTSPAEISGAGLSADGERLIFVGEMYGVQLDQLAAALGVTERRASALASRWRAAGLAQADSLGPGPRWVWLTKAGLTSCGLPYLAGAPGLSQLAHLRAVTSVRLALTATPQFSDGLAYWRSERRIRARLGGRIGIREHVPDGEVHWPDGQAVPWAGECWAIEAELTPKTVARTAAIMRELLTRTGDYGCVAADVLLPGQPPRHARAIYLCAARARPVVTRARESLGSLAARIEIRPLPAGAALPRPARAGPARGGPAREGPAREGSAREGSARGRADAEARS